MILAATILTAAMASAQQQGFSYQAVVRNAQGELVSNSKVGLRLTLTDSTGSQIMYSETQTVQTSAYAVLTVTVGSGTPENGATLDNVKWSSGNVWMRVEVDVTGGTNYTDMGLTKLQSVPYAYFAANGGQQGPKGEKGDKGDKGDTGPAGMQVVGQQGQTLVHNGETWVATDQLAVKKLDVKAANATSDALFEVKDKDGNVVFAVYPDGVRVYVDDNDGSKAARSGFLIRGRTATKDGQPKDYFAVNGDGTQVYVDDDPDSSKFAV